MSHEYLPRAEPIVPMRCEGAEAARRTGRGGGTQGEGGRHRGLPSWVLLADEGADGEAEDEGEEDEREVVHGLAVHALRL